MELRLDLRAFASPSVVALALVIMVMLTTLVAPPMLTRLLHAAGRRKRSN